MRIACVGGGPGGLFLGALVKRDVPDAEVVVFERNRATDAFGFGVVFSNATLGAIDDADSILRDALLEHGCHWDDIEVRVHGERIRCGGNGMAAIIRSTLLPLLQQRATEQGVDLRYETEVTSLDELADFDLVVAADGANSRFRRQHEDVFQPSVETATAKFIWFGTTYPYEGLTFVHRDGPHGAFAAHAYPIDDGLSTFIVETDEETWRRAGLDAFDVGQPPGPSDEHTQRYLEEVFADELDGHGLVGNNSRWGNFQTLRTGRWSAGRLVLLGDAAHTAHFSVGSGTKMAMEDAVALAAALRDHGEDLDAVLTAYEAERRPAVERVQNAAGPSLSWWENFGRYHAAFDPLQFVFHFLSRSITRERLARRDPDFVGRVDRWWTDVHGAPPLESSLSAGDVVLPARRGIINDTDAGAQLRVEDVTIPLARLGVDDAGTPAPGSGLLVRVPDDDAHRPSLEDRLARTLRANPTAIVVVEGGDEWSRVLLAEHARLDHGVPSALVGQHDDDEAETLVLSGRTDLVLERASSS